MVGEGAVAAVRRLGGPTEPAMRKPACDETANDICP